MSGDETVDEQRSWTGVPLPRTEMARRTDGLRPVRCVSSTPCKRQQESQMSGWHLRVYAALRTTSSLNTRSTLLIWPPAPAFSPCVTKGPLRVHGRVVRGFDVKETYNGYLDVRKGAPLRRGSDDVQQGLACDVLAIYRVKNQGDTRAVVVHGTHAYPLRLGSCLSCSSPS